MNAEGEWEGRQVIVLNNIFGARCTEVDDRHTVSIVKIIYSTSAIEMASPCCRIRETCQAGGGIVFLNLVPERQNDAAKYFANSLKTNRVSFYS